MGKGPKQTVAAPKVDASIKEDVASMRRYEIYWKTVDVADLTWEVLSKPERKKIARHLYDQVQDSAGCSSKFNALRVGLETHKVERREDFAKRVAASNFDTVQALFKLARPYVALYYSRVSGKFDPKHFVDNYRAANRF
jgi:hypothetical protein